MVVLCCVVRAQVRSLMLARQQEAAAAAAAAAAAVASEAAPVTRPQPRSSQPQHSNGPALKPMLAGLPLFSGGVGGLGNGSLLGVGNGVLGGIHPSASLGRLAAAGGGLGPGGLNGVNGADLWAASSGGGGW